MKQQLLAGAAVAGLAVVGLAAPAQAAPPDWAAMNHASYWETDATGDCWKVELPDGVGSYTLDPLDWPQEYTLLVIKAGSGSSANDVIMYPFDGMAYMHSSGKDISHVIICVGEKRS